jgi:hypothetical protein
MLARHNLTDGPDDDASYNKATLPSISFLPQEYYFADANLVITVRNMNKHEDRLAFDLISETKARGEGIAMHDMSNLAFFRSVILLEGPCIVFEDSSKGVVIGFACICPTWLTRSSQSKSVEITIVLAKQYQVNVTQFSNTIHCYNGSILCT